MRSVSLVAPPPGSALAWWLALRPWSFTISLAPVLAGTGLAGLDGHPPQLGLVLAALVGSILIHGGTNLQNDVGDYRRGADLTGRIGPRRATTEGWLTARQVQAAATLCFGLAVVPGFYLAAIGGWPIWGEFFVVAFFGLVAVCGMYYLHSGTVTAAPLLAGTAVGALAAAVLVVNNLRDIDSDRRIGKNTLAVQCGRRFTSWEYLALVHTPFALTVLLALEEQRAWLLAPLVLLPWTTGLALQIQRNPAGAWLNSALAATPSSRASSSRAHSA